MKRFFTVLVAALLILSLNAQEHKEQKHTTGDHENTPRIKGSGNVVTKDITISSFDQLEANGIYSLVLTQGDKESLKIEADDNLQELFEVKNEGSKLIVGMKKNTNIETDNKLKVYITFKKLKSMELKTIGNVSSTGNMNFDDLKISNKSIGSVDLKVSAQTVNVENKSVGNVKLDGKAQTATITNKGVGRVNAGSFVVEKMDIDNSGVGSAEVNVTKEIKVKDSFLGKVTNKGAAPMPKKLNKQEI
jgi:hypothetical protein